MRWIFKHVINSFFQGVEKHVETYRAIVDNMQKGKEAQTGMAFPETRDFKLVIKDKPDPEKTFMETADIFPNVLIMCGSAGGVIKVQ